ERAVVCALGEGGPLAMFFAATYPERTDGLVLINSSPRLVRSAELPWLPSRGEQEQTIEKMMREWGSPAHRELPSITLNPQHDRGRADGVRTHPSSEHEPGRNARLHAHEPRRRRPGVLGSIRVPTLVLHR